MGLSERINNNALKHINRYFLYLLPAILLVTACTNTQKAEPKLFDQLPADSTGINFINQLPVDDQFNIFTYRNFYNGCGVALGDINNDGLVDVFFTANMLPNRLFLNKGNFKFEDITEKSGILKKQNGPPVLVWQM
jgi:hypothetical protein